MTHSKRFSLYCDESRIHSARYMLIGGLWLPQELEETLRADLRGVREASNMTAEFKWTKVSQSKLDGYRAWVDCFFKNPAVDFRSIVIDTTFWIIKPSTKGIRNSVSTNFIFNWSVATSGPKISTGFTPMNATIEGKSVGGIKNHHKSLLEEKG